MTSSTSLGPTCPLSKTSSRSVGVREVGGTTPIDENDMFRLASMTKAVTSVATMILVEQGKIGLILSSKPGDRRALIEEAAGITKYRARRRQTQLKLEAAQQNLLRVNDIVNEVEKQLESLKRQAAKARRWRAVKEEMQGVERVVFGRRFVELVERSRVLEERHAAEAGRESAASVALETEEAQLEARRQLHRI